MGIGSLRAGFDGELPQAGLGPPGTFSRGGLWIRPSRTAGRPASYHLMSAIVPEVDTSGLYPSEKLSWKAGENVAKLIEEPEERQSATRRPQIGPDVAKLIR